MRGSELAVVSSTGMMLSDEGAAQASMWTCPPLLCVAFGGVTGRHCAIPRQGRRQGACQGGASAATHHHSMRQVLKGADAVLT